MVCVEIRTSTTVHYKTDVWRLTCGYVIHFRVVLTLFCVVLNYFFVMILYLRECLVRKVLGRSSRMGASRSTRLRCISTRS